MNIYAYIDRMLPFVQQRQWAALEDYGNQCATHLAGSAVAHAIEAVEMVAFEIELQHAIRLAYETIERVPSKAIYFEYDLDNSWQSNFFMCQEYNQLAVGDDDWACDWVTEVKGPEFLAFAELYNSTPGFDRTDLGKGTTLYLVAKTVAAFGRCAEPFLRKTCALCLAFHDQNPIMRIKEFGL